MGLLELLIIILVLAAIFGGIRISPLLFVLLIVVVVILVHQGRVWLSTGAASMKDGQAPRLRSTLLPG